MDNPQVRKHERKDVNSRSSTPASQPSVLRMDGNSCRVGQYCSSKNALYYGCLSISKVMILSPPPPFKTWRTFFLYLFCKSPKNSVPLVPQGERAIPGAGYPEVIYFSTTFRTIATYKFAFRQLFSSIVNFFSTCLLQSSGKIRVHLAWRRNQFPLNSFDFVIIANFRQRDRRHRFIDRNRQRIWEEGECRIV